MGFVVLYANEDDMKKDKPGGTDEILDGEKF
jgi:hypothetical protein